MSDEKWFIRVQDQVLGPISDADLRDRAMQGSLTAQTQVSRNGSDWTEAAAVGGIVFGLMPSPVTDPQWWLASQGAPTGPHSEAFVLAGFKAGVILPQTKACPAGDQEWRKLCEWPAFAASCAGVPQPEATILPVSPPIPSTEQSSRTCPLCEKEGSVGNNARALYGHHVCPKCYYVFAIRRQLAFVFDLLFFLFVVAVLAVLGYLGGLIYGVGDQYLDSVTMTFSNPTFWFVVFGVFVVYRDCGWEMRLGLLLFPVVMFLPLSPGRKIFGVQLIDQTTGKPPKEPRSIASRNLILLIPIMPLIVGLQLCKGQRIGDGWSRTKVIWKRFANHPIFATEPGDVSKPKKDMSRWLSRILVAVYCLVVCLLLGDDYRYRGCDPEMHEYDEVIAGCSEKIQLDPKNTEAYCVRGWAYLAKGESGKAIGDCTEAIQQYLRQSRSGDSVHFQGQRALCVGLAE